MSLKDDVIAHWQRMHDDAPGCDSRYESPGGEHCLFCKRFLGCNGCPIYKATGFKSCLMTPYLDAQRAWADYKDSGWTDATVWQAAASLMIEFLKGLPNES